MRNKNTPIAAEGYPFVAIAGFITVVLALLAWKVLAAFFLVVTLFVVFFFRNPQRITPGDENAVVSPADGVVIYLGNARESHLDEEMMKISIFMSVFNVHINRVPVSGRVVDRFYLPGKFLDVRDERATFENEQNGLVLETARGVKMVVVQVAGLIARRIVCYPKIGDMLQRGQRYGLIRFGSRLDVYLPKNVELRVSMGDKTVAGETILGILP
ncbi:phosphatidylserine decarboxylase family protein [Geotalea uraniireducens]|uniref:Phosphatidylserine decarboxylase proenzyme n=1 Tax=Geotalea uraniireducens (strain Rf4) TaxID=351605 RepID=PSD_GEOUR|nr:phosphatidylserine decarboxylase family protein [Geotalea uraniireducens]A5G7V2.1 RecName: Full=Phosphatidylserine decarboxylase proenzyme; Contains: RecName: Full=Phosphatidylserine decarboxylase alpha chain; Contains: RecName: Full=Phosphatidylserine decarboxylase beta chain [Geotalea uraniireducens Rf4]ABQ27870.1 phosphatidylserine decarboxylase related protein [Geotalea uraniireducens Rf4]